jgi:hypothetical protein
MIASRNTMDNDLNNENRSRAGRTATFNAAAEPRIAGVHRSKKAS